MTLRDLGEEAGGIDYATVSAATARWKKRLATGSPGHEITESGAPNIECKDVTPMPPACTD
jgi:hypothetical protein